MTDPIPLLDRVELLHGRRRSDERGWLHVPLTASLVGHGAFGEVYVFRSERPGQRRGDHLHPGTDELFSVVEGRGELRLVDPEGGERRSIQMDADAALTVRVPAGLAHCLVNLGPGALTAVAWASREHDPADVVPFPVDPEDPV
jgi:oxalate decarboxylase/phosphoglucose isomerase-like protein (cupin superfamily)